LNVVRDGKPAVGQFVWLQRQGTFVSQQVDARGKWEHDFTQGGAISVKPYGAGLFASPEEVTLVEGKTVSATIKIERTPALTVEIANTEGLLDYRVQVTAEPDPAVVKKLSAAALQTVRSCKAKPAGHGTWSFDCLRPGAYDVNVTTPMETVHGRGLTGATLKLALPMQALLTGVVNDETGKPLENVDVYARGGGLNREGKSNAQGQFAIRVPPGTYEVTVSTYSVLLERGKATVTAALGQSTPVTLVAKGPGVIEGVAVNAAGKPLPGATVFGMPSPMAATLRMQMNPRLMALMGQYDSVKTTADESGHFSLRGPPELDVWAMSEGYESIDAVKMKAGTPGKVVAGRMCEVKGKLTGRGGAKLESPQLQGAQVKADGSFSFFATLNQEQWLKATAPGHIPKQLKLTPTGEHLDLGNVVLEGGGDLTGQVVDMKTGAPVPQAGVNVQSEHMAQQSVYAGADGRFRFEAVPSEPITLTVSSGTYLMVTRTVMPDAPVTIALGNYGSMTIALTDSRGNPVPNHTLALEASHRTETRTDDFGMATFDRLEPGDWTLTVEPLRARGPGLKQAVKVGSGEHLDLPLKLEGSR
jgi:hypothetical protein